MTETAPHPEPASPGSEPAGGQRQRELPPDPAAYDSYRNELARRRGLPQPYISGGGDPELDTTLRRERRYVRLLLVMVAGIVALGFVLGLIGALLTVSA